MREKACYQLHKDFSQITSSYFVRFYTSSKPSIRRIAGKQRNHIAVTPKVAIPPSNTAGMVQRPAAHKPALKSPSSLEAFIDTELTALTLPLI